MPHIKEIVKEVTKILSECINDPERITPFVKKRIDNAQQLLMDYLYE